MFTHIMVHGLFEFIARGGGGGHGGGGGGGGHGGGGYSGSSYGGGGSFWLTLIFILLYLSFYLIKAYFARRKRSQQPTSTTLAEPSDASNQTDPEELTQDRVIRIFYAFQRDWSNNDSNAMQAYLTKRYAYNVGLMLMALQALGRRNVMEDVNLTGVIGTNGIATSDTMGTVMEVQARAKDMLLDTQTMQVCYTDTDPFSEYWQFVQEEGIWKLDNIQQTTEQENVLHPAIANFAATNGFFYSGEWGNLLLPTRGQLFSAASFALSAINDHVIGLYKNVIIEFYTYLPNKDSSESYTIAQAVLPKSYGNIIVSHNSGWLHFTPHGLSKIQTEWPDFNKKYSVYASNMERATSFELLNPSFMVKIEELPFELNIEVVDNIVYLHTKQSLEDFSPMLHILYLAFQEMKL